jgi:hypothetical protein
VHLKSNRAIARYASCASAGGGVVSADARSCDSYRNGNQRAKAKGARAHRKTEFAQLSTKAWELAHNTATLSRYLLRHRAISCSAPPPVSSLLLRVYTYTMASAFRLSSPTLWSPSL